MEEREWAEKRELAKNSELAEIRELAKMRELAQQRELAERREVALRQLARELADKKELAERQKRERELAELAEKWELAEDTYAEEYDTYSEDTITSFTTDTKSTDSFCSDEVTEDEDGTATMHTSETVSTEVAESEYEEIAAVSFIFCKLELNSENIIFLNRIIYWITKCGRPIANSNNKWIYNSLTSWKEQFRNFNTGDSTNISSCFKVREPNLKTTKSVFIHSVIINAVFAICIVGFKLQ